MSSLSKCFAALFVAVVLCLSSSGSAFVDGFIAVSPIQQQQQQQWKGTADFRQSSRLYETSIENEPASASLKTELLQLAASYDRGYGATKRANEEVDSLISKLEAINPETNASQGVEGDDTSPLSGSWRMVWTTAPDVLTLNANPLVTVGAIYQVFDLPKVTNIIDLLPPFQTLIGSSQMGSVLRAKVTTKACRAKNQEKDTESNKIGLNFEKVALEPVELLGNDVGFLPPLGFDLPPTPFEGYFDVTFLDQELLIVRQNAPGGLFVLAKVDNFDP